ncbi:MAG TPA: hypothetical protein VKM55_14290 [Candidatus Lokiarchaeia archaeon]|nr:hypothetical protein [Candidatus Lokiarchaeia archaeon]
MVIADLELPEVDVERVAFDTFWARSRFALVVQGLNLVANVRGAIDEIVRDGGFATFLSCTWQGHFGGSLVVFKDPWYRSRGRDDVACFGLVTASNTAMLDVLVNAARREARSNGFDVIRGPVNPPRSLFGYGVQASGFDTAMIAGSAADPVDYHAMFAELDEGGTFDGKDTYHNLLQNFDKTLAYIDSIDLDRNFQVVNPDLDNLGKLPEQVANLMNDTLGNRPDYQATSAERLGESSAMYKIVPGGNRLLAFYFDGNTLAGGVIMQPDWFQVLAGKPMTTVVGDIYMLAPAYQGRRLFMNFSEYSIRVLQDRGIGRLEHASIWEEKGAVMSSVKNGYASIIKTYHVYELRA